MIVVTKTKFFKNDNSQAEPIPSEPAYNKSDIELFEERRPDGSITRPERRRIGEIMDKLSVICEDRDLIDIRQIYRSYLWFILIDIYAIYRS